MCVVVGMLKDKFIVEILVLLVIFNVKWYVVLMSGFWGCKVEVFENVFVNVGIIIENIDMF